jgi:plastocyanin
VVKISGHRGRWRVALVLSGTLVAACVQAGPVAPTTAPATISAVPTAVGPLPTLAPASSSAVPSASTLPSATDPGTGLRSRGFPDTCPEVSDSFERLNAATYQVFGEQVFRDAEGQAALAHVPLGTAWAVGERVLATNAHVVASFPDAAAAGVQLSRAIAVQSGTGTVISLSRALIHPGYDPQRRTPDVGLFESEQTLPTVLELAPSDSVLGLGDEIQIVGFPGDVDMFLTVVPGETVPQATSLSGRITARRSFVDTEIVTADTLSIYQHQAPTSPGTSGSAMFHCGLVAGVNNAGTVRLVITPDPAGGGSFLVDRQPAASNNFGIHVRYIHDVVDSFGPATAGAFELPVPAAQAPGTPTETAAPNPATAHDVAIVDFGFQAPELTIAAGDAVRWTNTGQVQHTVTGEDVSFNSGPIDSGASIQTTFENEGAFLYFCSIHPQQMRGSVIVTGGAPLPSGRPAVDTALVGRYAGSVTDPTAQHTFAFVVDENGVVQGTSIWAETGEFGLAGSVNADGTFQMSDDAPERRGFRRGIYQGRITVDGSVVGVYFEQTQEQTSWSFTAQREQ